MSASLQAPPPPPPPSSQGSPLLWIGVGVGLAVVLSKAANYLKDKLQRLAMEQVMKQMSQGAAGQSGASPFGSANPFGTPGASPFGGMPFPTSPPYSSRTQAPPGPTVDVTPSPSPPSTDRTTSVPAEPVAAVSATSTQQEAEATSAFQDESRTKKKSFFQDAEVFEDAGPSYSWSGYGNTADAVDSSAAANGTGDIAAGSGFTVEQLEKMLEDPTMQKMILPYLPEGMQNMDTFKWVLQNPEYRRQMQESLNQMGAGGAFDEKLGGIMSKYNINSPEVKAQFAELGVAPEDMVKRVMENPDVAMAFQNPRIQKAILDCAANPMNQFKYVNDKEVMDVFSKLAAIFPNVMKNAPS